jgi:hypothetical protein
MPATANKTARIVCDCRCPDSAIAVLQRLLVRKLVEKKGGGGSRRPTITGYVPYPSNGLLSVAKS